MSEDTKLPWDDHHDYARRDTVLERRKQWCEEAVKFWMHEYAEEGDYFASNAENFMHSILFNVTAPLNLKLTPPRQ